MKVCNYCGSRNEDRITACEHCGASDFSNVCENCGEVFDTPFCPNCGVKAGNKGLVCPRCGKHFFTAYCPSCGYSSLKKQETVTRQVYVPVNDYVTPEPVSRRKRAGAGAVVLAIMFPYVMIFFSTFGRLFQSKASRIALAVWNAVIAFGVLGTAIDKSSSSLPAMMLFSFAMIGMSVYSTIKTIKEKE